MSCSSKKEEVRKFIEQKGGKLLSDYVNNKTPLKAQCDKGHIWHPTWTNLQRGKWCQFCNSKKRITFNDAKNLAKSRGGALISSKIINSKEKLKWKCSEDHFFNASFSSVKNGNTWCPYCAGNWRSEEICRAFLEEGFNKKFPKFRSDWLKNTKGYQLELDGYCEELGLAFEHHGIQHYQTVDFFNSNTTLENNIKNDNIKKDLCNKFGVKLIIIPALFKKTKLKELPNVINKQLKKMGFNLINKDVPVTFFSKNDFCLRQLGIIKSIVESKGGICLSEEYISAKTKLHLKCKNGHSWKVTPDKIKQGTWCPSCSRSKGNLDKNIFKRLHFTEGKSFHQVCKDLSVTRAFLLKQCRIWNIKPNLQKLNASPDEIKKLLSMGLSKKDIAQRYGVNRKTIYNFLKKM